jgi:hypothetical protein
VKTRVPRWTTSWTVDPSGPRIRRTDCSNGAPTVDLPSIDTITSPGRIPARNAGPCFIRTTLNPESDGSRPTPIPG